MPAHYTLLQSRVASTASGPSGVPRRDDRRRRRRSCVLALGVALLVGSCAHYQPKPIALDATAASLESRSLTNMELRAFLTTNLGREFPTWPVPSWDFETLTWVAFYYQPALELARAQWAVATAGRKTAAGRPNPTLTVAPGYDFNAVSGVSPWIPGFSFDVPIETAGKRGHRIARAEQLAESARLNITTAAWQVRSRLRTALIDLTTSQRRRDLLRQELEVQRLIRQLLEQRLQAGAASTIELSLARLAVVKLEADVADAERLATDARSQLAEVLGLGLAALNGFEFSLAPDHLGAVPDPDRARRLALQTRSDMRAALAQYEASQAALQLELARQYPDLHVGSTYQWDQGENKWTLPITLEVPLLNRNQGPIAEAEAKRTEAAALLLALQARVIAEIDRAAAARGTIGLQRQKLEQAHETVRQQLELLGARLNLGGADQLEYQNARLEESLSALAVLDAAAKATLAAGQLEDALQIPFPALSIVEQGTEKQAKKE